MRVAFVITRSDVVGGAQVHVRDVAGALLRDGHQVHVLAGGRGPYLDQLAERNIPHSSVPHLTRFMHPVKDGLALVELRRSLREIGPDLVSAHSSKVGWLGRVAARSLGLPVLLTAHGWCFTEGVAPRRRALYRLAERLVVPLARRIITVSEHDRQLPWPGWGLNRTGW